MSLTIKNDPSKVYTYDSIFSPEAATNDVFKTIMRNDVEDKLLKGFNLTVLAYGQTGSGKTYTMGTNYDSGEGVIPQAVVNLFKSTKKLKADSDFEIKMSYLEIYNEEIKDLLASETAPSSLKICENLGGEVSGERLVSPPSWDPYSKLTRANPPSLLSDQSQVRVRL